MNTTLQTIPQGEIILYQPDETISLEVRLEDDTVWLTQQQIIDLFQSSKANISEHIKNIYDQGELLYEATVRNFRTVRKEGARMVRRNLTHYNLDAIISIGFRVNAKRGIKFRQWANGVIKNYMLHGYAINQQLTHLEQRVDARIDAQQYKLQKIETTLADHQEKIDFFVRTNLPPIEGVFYNGQIFDAYVQIADLIKQANYNGTPNVNVHCGENISIGYVYGGGNAATVTGTNVTIEGGNKIGNVFGGCYGANVTTNGTKVNVKGGTIGKVFGGNNQSGTITGAIKVRVDKQSTCPMKIGELYGGGNVAPSAVGSIDIGCTGDLTAAHANCNETDNRIGYELEGIGDVYGGANAAAVTGNVNLTIDSGMVYRVFGNNNTSASVSGTITVNIDQQNDACGWYVGYVFGGGNNAPYGTAGNNYPAVNHTTGKVTYNVYGGGKGNTATVTGNPQVTLSGTAEVGGNVYGGGDAAAVTGSTKVTLKD